MKGDERYMTEEKEKKLMEFGEIFLQLDPVSRLIVQSNAKVLLARDQMTELRKEKETVQQ